MITLNKDGGLVRYADWSAIQSLPGYVQDLDPSRHKLESIVGRYAEKEEVRCGLSNCHTPHQRGYVVRTEDGHVTNIGKDCGRTYFGVDFETMSRNLDRDIENAENRERLWSFSFQADEVDAQIQNIRREQRGADWVHAGVQYLTTRSRGCPDPIVDRVTSMVKVRSNTLTAQRQLTEREIEELEAALAGSPGQHSDRRLPRPQYREEPIGTIDGFSALYPENNLRELLVLELEKGLQDFRMVDINSLISSELRRWVRWVNSVDSTCERARDIVDDGRRLLTSTNLRLLATMLKNADDKATFRAFLNTLPSAH